MVTSKLLNRVALATMVIPLGVVWTAILLESVIPDCKIQMYGVSACMIGPYNLAAPLFLAGMGATWLFLVLTPFVSVPLFVVAWVIRRLHREKLNDV